MQKSLSTFYDEINYKFTERVFYIMYVVNQSTWIPLDYPC